MQGRADTLSPISQILVAACVVAAIAAAIDFRTGQIPNWLTLGLLAIGPVAHVAWWTHHFPAVGILLAILQTSLGALVCAAVPYLLWKKNAMGGGDLKLLAGLGALLGPVLGMQIQLYSFLVASLIAPMRLAYEGRLLAMLGNTARLAANPFRPKARRFALPDAAMTEFRFGPCIFFAVIATTLLVR